MNASKLKKLEKNTNESPRKDKGKREGKKIQINGKMNEIEDN